MKKLLFVALVLALLFLVVPAFADDPYPEGVEVFQVGDHTCVMSPTGYLECFCACGTTCATESIRLAEETVTFTSEPAPAPVTPTPTDEPVPPTPVPTHEPPHRHQCNRGIGNGSENCDPGNSYGHGQGEARPAGEDRRERPD